MASQVSQIFKTLKCQNHQFESVVQVCVSSRCTESNRLCCLQCVDESHCGQDHILISQKKFILLLQEFHGVIEQKQQLNKRIITNIATHKNTLQQHVEKYYQLIEDSLTKENQISSYEEINRLDVKSMQAQDLKRKINQLVGNHSWILQINVYSLRNHFSQSGIKTTENQDAVLGAKQALRSKYLKLQEKLEEINKNAQNEINQAIQKRSLEVKKLINLFDQIKYKIDDDGKILQANSLKHEDKKNLQATPTFDSPVKEAQNKTLKSYFDFFGI